MAKTAWVFPGQGSQTPGMGGDLLDTPTGQTRFAEAESLLGWSVPQLCQQEDKLSRTLYTQPCLYVVSAILADLVKAEGLAPAYVAGHSLGEYVALYVAGVFDFTTGLKLVQRRSQLMEQCGNGAMAALIGFNRSQLETALEQQTDVVLANDNHADQVVISGTPAAVEQLLSQIKVKRAVRLNVSGAFHSPLMATAAAEFGQTLEQSSFSDAQIPVLSNVDPQPAIAAEVLKQRLQQQMTGQVRWRETCLQMTQLGVEQVVEIGPGKVLTGLIKRTSPEISLANISTLADIPTAVPTP
uniref:Malonyl CoA-acyl carrier protein transacylase n=1 Tax=Cyanothece sp. (strain PCC 7425 / ATCC 29141) TaxID=395961 RepID=B8HVJ4_CYAP4